MTTTTRAQGTVGNWGRWGESDERGALNLLDEETVLAARDAIATGKVYQLALPIQRSGVPSVEYRGIAQRLTLTSYSDSDLFGAYGAPPDVGANEDMLIFASHTTTHMDALCHVHAGGTVYNGFPREMMTSYEGASRCGIEKTGAFATRGILVDVAGNKGVDCLEAGYAVTPEDLQEAMAAQGTDVRAGDAVLVRTGWVEHFYATGAEMSLEQPGVGLDAARWLADRDVVAVGGDNSSVEPTPWDKDEFLGVHRELLVKRGIYLIEHLQLADLARDRCYEFLLSVSPLLITGATGCPVNPIAIG
jgi:kynurenine formamidase